MSSFSIQNHWNNNLFFRIWVISWKISRIYFAFLAYMYNSCPIIFLEFFPIILVWWKIYFFPVIFIKSLTLFLFAAFFLFLHDLTPLLQHIKSLLSFYRYYLLLLFCFFFIWENLNMIHQASDLFYGIYNEINEHNRRQTYYLSLIPNYFDIYL